MKKIHVLILAMLLPATGALAQDAAPEETHQVVVLNGQRNAVRTSGGTPQTEDTRFLTVMNSTDKLVKNAPYTANEVTESTQTLADGNRIVNKLTASVARDGEGRTRREEDAFKVGGLQATGPKFVTIQDPVAHTVYVFNPDDPSSAGTTVVRMGEAKGIGIGAGVGNSSAKAKALDAAKAFDTKGAMIVSSDWDAAKQRGTKVFVFDNQDSSEVKHESLGVQVIEGVNAEGTRDTRTIPAGAIGNERSIVITSEVWISPDLQAVVLSKRSDPRVGETVYKLTNITRGEPDPALFQPPANSKR